MKRFFSWVLIAVALILCIVSCQRIELYSLAESTATATVWIVTEAPTLIPSATTVWFPPTATPRPLNTPTPFPTQDMKPDIGRLVVPDGFSDPGKWETYRSPEGNAVWANKEMTLAIHRTAGVVESYADLPGWKTFIC